MKTITNIKSTLSEDGKQITLTGDVIDRQFGFPVQQVTVLHASASNPHWVRHCQLSPEALFVKRIGCGGVAFLLDELVDTTLLLEPGLTYAPVFHKQPTLAGPTVLVDSEVQPAIKWQTCTDCKTWTDASPVSDQAPELKPGVLVRCVATNAVGQTISNVICMPEPKPDSTPVIAPVKV